MALEIEATEYVKHLPGEAASPTAPTRASRFDVPPPPSSSSPAPTPTTPPPPQNPQHSVIKVILQFCRENGLDETAAALQCECAVSLNTLPGGAPAETLAADVRAGRWDSVLRAVAGGGGGNAPSAALRLPRTKLADLYEQILLEMVEMRELAAARALLQGTAALQRLKRDDAERHARLAAACSGGTTTAYDAGEIYGPGTGSDPTAARDRRRQALAASLSAEVSAAPPGRLLALIGQALKWQRSQGLVPAGAAFDLLRGTATSAGADALPPDAADACAAVRAGECVVRMEAEGGAHAEAACFSSPDGGSLATGSADGFVELWDARTGKLRRDVPFQAQDAFMMHDAAVLCLAYSRDGELLATADAEGGVKVWRARTGLCLRRFDRAHACGVTSVALSRDGTQVLTGALDGTVRVHGLKSGRTLREMRGGHGVGGGGGGGEAGGGGGTAAGGFAVNSVCFAAPDGMSVALTGGADGAVRAWDARTGEPMSGVSVVRPPMAAGAAGGGNATTTTTTSDPAVVAVLTHPSLPPGHAIIVTRSTTAYLMAVPGGQVARTFEAPRGGAGRAAAAAEATAAAAVAGKGGATGAAAAAEAAGPAEFVGGCLSPRGELLYTLGEDGALYCFSVAEGKMVGVLAGCHASGKALGLAHHPRRNVVATFGSDGVVRTWEP
jgi:WD40 repeat-containing protein SMU1